MDLQWAFNIAVALLGFMGGWILNSVKDSINALKLSDVALADKVQHIEVLVAGNYVKREEYTNSFERLSEMIFRKLEKIEEILNGKMDKNV